MAGGAAGAGGPVRPIRDICDDPWGQASPTDTSVAVLPACPPIHRRDRGYPCLAIEPLYHLALAEDWQRAPEKDYETSTLGVSLSAQGFIHCSFRHQVQQIADLVYRGRDDVLLLKIDPGRLSAPVKVEALREGEEAFPHIYGPLNRQAVVESSRMRLLADGRLDASGVR